MKAACCGWSGWTSRKKNRQSSVEKYDEYEHEDVVAGLGVNAARCGWSGQYGRAETAPRNVMGAVCGSCSSRNTVWEHHKTILWLLQQQKLVKSLYEHRGRWAAGVGATNYTILLKRRKSH